MRRAYFHPLRSPAKAEGRLRKVTMSEIPTKNRVERSRPERRLMVVPPSSVATSPTRPELKSMHAQAGSRHQTDDYTQRRENGDIVNGRGAAGMLRQFSGQKDLIPRAQCHKKKHVLAQHQPKSQTRGEQYNALHLAQGQRGLPAIQNP